MNKTSNINLTPFQIGEMGNPKYVKQLIDILYSNVHNDMRLAASAIRKIAIKHKKECNEAVPALIKSLHCPAPQARQYILKALLSLDVPKVHTEFIKKISNDDDKEYNRNLAKQLLNKLYDCTILEKNSYSESINIPPSFNAIPQAQPDNILVSNLMPSLDLNECVIPSLFVEDKKLFKIQSPLDSLSEYLKRKETGIIPTQEQKEIVLQAAKMKPEEHLIISAFAGTAKTSSLEMIAGALPHRKFLYLAFNKAITEDARNKFPNNVEVRTTHSLAFRYTGTNRKLRNSNYHAAEIAEMFSIDHQKAKSILLVFEYYCNSAFSKFDDIKADADDINNARKLYMMMLANDIDATHSFYLKEFQLFLLRGYRIDQKYDYCLLDEAQDTNHVTLSIFENLPGRKIKVGDRHQSCYAFRGAINAMDERMLIESNCNVTLKQLTTSFRCQSHILDHANWVLGTFKNEKTKIVSGNLEKNKIKNQVVISRCNSTLIYIIDELYDFNLTRAPELIFNCVLSLLNWKYGMISAISKSYKFITKFQDISEIEEYAEITRDHELNAGIKVLKFYDNYQWEKKGFKNGDKIRSLFKKAQNNYSINGSSVTTLSTAHSVKGLEFDRALLCKDFFSLEVEIKKLIARKIINTEDDIFNSQHPEVIGLREEANLYYISITRARYELIDHTINLRLYDKKMTLGDIWSSRPG